MRTKIGKQMLTKIQKRKISPLQMLVLGYATVIIFGASLLLLPISRLGVEVTFINALFTAVSAVCVTGLVVVDTATTWSPFGQVVILLLIQIGGIGILAFITSIQIVMKQKINLKQRLLVKQDISGFDLKKIVLFVRRILIYTFVIEGIAAIILASQFIPIYGVSKGLWFGVFHAISAFCNAGFDLIGNFQSLVPFQSNPIILYTVATTIILGGLGFFVYVDITERKKKFSFHTKLVLTTTIILLVGGTILIGLSEYGGQTLAGLSPIDKLNNIFFMAVTPRTAGFTTVDLTLMNGTTNITTIILMFIGGSPGSTAGGIKTTTIAVVFISLFAVIRRRKDAEVFERRINNETLLIAQTILTLSMLIVMASTIILTYTDKHFSLLAIVFEVVSAFGTVGSSLNMTPGLSFIGKLIIMILMFIGRVGPLTFALSVMKETKGKIILPDGRVLIG
ncbi:potassium uptake protein, TrkH family [Erysipelotrichaceae bacterium]|nr:potassium uptake protein, TrkH family [Erysipelotrichaceae bacterium]